MHIRFLVVGVLLAGALPSAATAQGLDSLVVRALAKSPAMHAAMARVDAARARVSPASTLPDPMFMLGIINQPLGSTPRSTNAHGEAVSASGPDPMTMRMVGVSQTIPFPGKLLLQRRAAEREVDASQAALDAARRQLVRDVKVAYYEIAFLDHALAIVDRNRDVLATLIAVSETKYGVGTAGQQDVLKARVEATRLAETASGLLEQRRTAVAQLNALLDQPSDTPFASATVPDAVARAAVPASADVIRFSSAALGSRAADSPLRPLDELQAAAVQGSPEIREHLAMLAAQTARVELARKGTLPDVDLSLQYGQRGGGLPDMISATVSLPLPVFQGRKQDQQVTEASAQVAVLEGEHHEMVNAIRADVARLVSDIERDRTSLALSVKAILPQSRAALTSAAASYQVGKADFLTVLENQATVFNYETDYYRTLSDFASKVAELERVVGSEVLK
jgi:outer membrane protein TolC